MIIADQWGDFMRTYTKGLLALAFSSVLTLTSGASGAAADSRGLEIAVRP
ncbi:hypothetical protein GCM10009665_79830 [Kitasatospora nipponensis]|uniref:Uncharacterized protein n=1 Tax=Kitasatospora nipponensis TaxID=258049 RepID=A0ABP4DWS6_9ACTN